MAQKERKEEAARRVRREFDTYAGSVLLSEPEGAAVSGDSSYTWKSYAIVPIGQRSGMDLPERSGAILGGRHSQLARPQRVPSQPDASRA
jgi:hypothetical protein